MHRKKLGEIELITQKNDGDCYIACAAMLTGMDYDILEQTATELGFNNETGGDHRNLLKRLGYGIQSCRGMIKGFPCIAALPSRYEEPDEYHAVVLDIKHGMIEILDPCRDEDRKADLLYLFKHLIGSMIIVEKEEGTW